MEEIIIVLFMLLAVGIGVGIVYAIHTRRSAAWEAAAETLGLSFEGGLLRTRISGRLKGCDVVVETVSEGMGKTRSTVMRYEVRYPLPLAIGLRITRDSLFTGLARRLGVQELEIGDPEFDERYALKGDHPIELRRFLTPARRAHVDRFMRRHPGAVIGDAKTTFHNARTMCPTEQIVETIEAMVALALVLSEDEPAGQDDQIVEGDAGAASASD